MTSVPYPVFVNDAPVSNDRASLASVGKCRICPIPISNEVAAQYRSIVEKCMEQSDAASVDDKQLSKKCMKEGVAMAKSLLIETLKLDVSIIDVEVVVSADDVLKSDGCLASCLLDAGCHAIVLDGRCVEAMDAARIPRERLVAHFSSEPTLQELVVASSLASTVSVEYVSQGATTDSAADLAALLKLGEASAGTSVAVQVCPGDCNVENDSDFCTMIGQLGGTIALVDPTPEQLGGCFAACIRTDRPDGLYTTVVCTRAGEALGLVYSSKESIVAALECGRGVYYSRSRKSLWRKGDTSGHYQVLHRLDVDCDGDALRFTVTQRGDPSAFCHLNTLTCWGEPGGLRHLEQTLQERLKSAPEGSYTKRLFDDEVLLRDKLVEEAQELSEAQEPQHVAEELADVLYFAMTRAAKAGVSLDDAIAELDRRARKVTRRKGDSKAFRIAAGQKILDKPKGES